MSSREINKIIVESISLSRPRFWIYLAGPFIVGFFAGFKSVETLLIFVYGLLYFMVPANIFLYGVNDIYDAEIDRKNPKKLSYERYMPKSREVFYRNAVVISALLSLPLFVYSDQKTVVLLLLFFSLAYFYSASPLRFKTKPVLDFTSNFLYALPGFIGYSLVSDSSPSLIVIIAAVCWTGAMHLFSAIVDIEADRKERVSTSATFWGEKKSLFICSMLWLVASVSAVLISPYLLPVFLYPVIPVIVEFGMISKDSMYKKFPVINTVLGFCLFLYVFLGP